VAAALFLVFVAATVGVSAELPGGAVGELIVATATVEKIDMATRTVTLKGEDGRLETIKVGPEARNLGQVKVGDKVTFKYYEAVALFVAPTDPSAGQAQPSYAEVTSVERAPAGGKPGGVVTSMVEATAAIDALDRKKRTVTIRGPEGNVRTIKVGDQVALDNVKAGDQVVLRFTEAMAISVEKP
jgi:Cu/Ag efflux protein CusF